jgi:hypothetical protein
MATRLRGSKAQLEYGVDCVKRDLVCVRRDLRESKAQLEYGGIRGILERPRVLCLAVRLLERIWQLVVLNRCHV